MPPEHEPPVEAQLRQANKMDAQPHIAHGDPHDFDDTFAAIAGNSDLLHADLAPDDPRRSEVQAIRDAVTRGTTLTRQLFTLSGQLPTAPDSVDLNALVHGLERELARLAGDRVALATALEPRFGRVRADPRELEQVLLNLVLNARDAMPGGGQITVETQNLALDPTYTTDHRLMPSGQYVLLAVSDTGSGMDAATKAHLFEPYFTTKSEHARPGLGLATVYGIVKRSDGFVWVYSELGVGTSVKVYLPRTDTVAPLAAPKQPPVASLRGTETVLLVEDEDAVRAVARQVLARHGYAVIEVAGPEEALALTETTQGVDLLLTDIVMPGVGGRALAAQFTARRPGTRVPFMSGYPDAAIGRHQMLERGLAFLQKPFSAEALARKVREVLG